jgi:coiled-coil and C2 domain-containing protein 2A
MNDSSYQNVKVVHDIACLKGVRAARNVFQILPVPDLSFSFAEWTASYGNFTNFFETLRARLLRTRLNRPFLLKTPIPLFDKVISKSENFKSFLEQDSHQFIGPTAETKSRDNFSNTLLEKVRHSKTNRSRYTSRRYASTVNLVIEADSTLNLSWFSILDLSWVVPARRRSLKPGIRVKGSYSAFISNCRLLVQVVGAKNLPKRVGPSTTDDNLASSSGHELRPVVQVSFQEHSKSTTPLLGTNPMWRQSFSFAFTASQMDFSPEALALVEDEVNFSIFDEVIDEVDIQENNLVGRDSLLSLNQRYLGKCMISFSTIAEGGRIDGTLRLQTPLFNLGYSIDEESHDASIGSDSSAIVRAHLPFSEGACYLNVMSTLDPLVRTIDNTDANFLLGDVHPLDQEFCVYARNWLKKLKRYNANCRNRHFRVFCRNSQGKHVMMCRYLSNLAPPKNIDTTRKCVHFVSLLPFLADASSFVGESDVWCTVHETLDVCAGDEEEHALLLYNFLNYLKKAETIYLVIGKSIPEGNALYILTSEKIMYDSTHSHPSAGLGYVFIDPIKGFVYSSSDLDCPLREIFMLVSDSNLWANVQVSEALQRFDYFPHSSPMFSPYHQSTTLPYAMSFDVHDSTSWLPFFDCKSNQNDLKTIQIPVDYFFTNEAFCVRLEKEILMALKNSMRGWRSRRLRADTFFHPKASEVAYDVLKNMDLYMMRSICSENSQNYGLSAIEETKFELSEKLHRLVRSSNFHGFPLNLSFSDVTSICRQVSFHSQNDFILSKASNFFRLEIRLCTDRIQMTSNLFWRAGYFLTSMILYLFGYFWADSLHQIHYQEKVRVIALGSKRV